MRTNGQRLAFFERVFADAQVVDIDASQWDSGLTLHVFPHFIDSNIPGEMALLAVRFHDVRSFEWSFRHHDYFRAQGETREPGRHLGWSISNLKLAQGETSEAVLTGSEYFPISPILKIVFRDLDSHHENWRMFGAVDPDYRNPANGFYRPGIGRLHDLLRGSRPARDTPSYGVALGTPTDDQLSRLERIFADAVVVDVDASRWDGVITLYVFADHDPAGTPGKLALLAVRFREVRHFQWAFPHHRHFEEQGLERKANRHLKWVVDRIGIVPGEIGEATLAGGELSPTLKIAFRDVEIEPVSWRIFADVDPDWNAPWTGFARPGIERLHALMTGSLKPATPATAPGHRPSMAMLKGEAPATRAQ